MYGFGDVANPAADSIAVLDDLVIDYITDMVTCFYAICQE
jgi:transcription initiation factor TFIID subunit 13